MLEEHEFCDNCPGCKPVIIDANTNQPFPPNSPEMIAVMDVWDNDTTYEERKAFIEVTLHNSQAKTDMELCELVAEKVIGKMKIALGE